MHSAELNRADYYYNFNKPPHLLTFSQYFLKLL